jgi:uncharacterized membrane protein
VFQVTLQQGYSVFTLLLVLAVSLVLTWFVYRRTFARLRNRQWTLLFMLRSAAILVVVLLLFRPILNHYREVEDKKTVVFAIDTSASMSVADTSDGQTRLAQATARTAEWWGRLDGPFHVEAVEFSDHSNQLGDVGQLTTLVAEGPATAITRGLAAPLRMSRDGRRLAHEDIAALVILSDGVDNSARRPDEEALKLQFPIYTVGVGASQQSDLSYQDLRVVGIDCPDSLMLYNIAQIKASVSGRGMAGRIVRIILEEDGESIQESDLTIADTEGVQEFVFEFRPQEQGRHKYTVRIPVIEGEKIEQNNERSAISLVVEPGIRVLYIEGALREEFGAISERFLSKDPDLEFCSLIQTRPNVFLRRTNIEGLTFETIPNDQESFDMFDVFIIGDLDSSYLPPPQQEMIVNRIRAGAGLIMLGGSHSLGPGGYDGSTLGAELPVLLGDREIGQVNDEFLPVLTPDGTHSPVFANIVSFFPTRTAGPQVDGLPPLSGCTRVLDARPGATILATCPLEQTISGQEMPVLTFRTVDEGRTVVFTADTTRAWQQGPRALDQESPFLRFWGQIVRFLAGRAEEVELEAGVTATTNKAYFELDETILIAAIVRDAQGEGTSLAEVDAEIVRPEGGIDRINLSQAPGSEGHFSMSYTPETSGEFEIRVSAELDSQTVNAEPMLIEVGRANMEFDVLDLDERLLASIASNARGRYVHISAAEHLIDDLDRTERKRREYLEWPLAPSLPLWILFVLLLTMEWALRRRFQLR